MPLAHTPALLTASTGSGFIPSGLVFEEADRHAGHNGRYGVFVDELRQAISAQEDAKIIEPSNDALQLYPVYEEHRDRNLVFSDMI